MGGAVVEELIDILRNISASLTVKFSHALNFLLKYKQASSFGLIAGFAIAVLCTWRYLRSPRNRRASSKRSPAAAQASDGEAITAGAATATATATGAAVSITNATHRGYASKEPATSAEVSLSGVVKRQLNGGRKMTCQLLGVILEETNVEDLQNGARIKPGAIGVLKELGSACDVYLLGKIVDDASETAVFSALEDSGLFSSGAINPNKVLFCSTDIGLISFVRQLEPDWHVDSCEETISQLRRFVRHQLWIAPVGSPELGPSVVSTPTLERYFGLPS